jgi:hypothetical protein
MVRVTVGVDKLISVQTCLTMVERWQQKNGYDGRLKNVI